MTRKIALEEHFLVEGFANMGRTEGSGPAAVFRRQAAERRPEIDALRLDAMDRRSVKCRDRRHGNRAPTAERHELPAR